MFESNYSYYSRNYSSIRSVPNMYCNVIRENKSLAEISEFITMVILDSPVRSSLFTLDRQNYNQVSENSCAEAVPSTPPSEVVWSE